MPQDLPILTVGMLLLAGMLLHAGAMHAATAGAARHERPAWLMTALCLSVALVAISNVWVYRTESVAEAIGPLRWNLNLILLANLLLLGFIEHHAARPRTALVWASTLLVMPLWVVNSSAPHTLQFSSLRAMQVHVLPWGERLQLPAGDIGPLFVVGALWAVAVVIYGITVFASRWRQERRRSDLIMMLAFATMLAGWLQGALVRMGWVSGPHLGPLAIAVLMPIVNLTYLRRLRNDKARAEASLAEGSRRSIRERDGVMRLLTGDARREGQLDTSLQAITVTISEHLDVARASVWLLSDDQRRMRCLSLYDRGSGEHSKGFELDAESYPQYFRAIAAEGRALADDALTHPATAEFAEGYLKPQGISSMLDVGIHRGGRLVGVLCLEHVGTARHWHGDEEAFVAAAASMVGEVLANVEREKSEAAIRSIANAVSSGSGEAFFLEMVRQLARLLEHGAAWIAVLDRDDPSRLLTLATTDPGNPGVAAAYRVTGSACANVLQLGRSHVARGARTEFPSDVNLARHGAEAYVGVRLLDAEGRPLGVAAVVSDRPVESLAQTWDILEIFANRAAAEILRLRVEAHVRQMAYYDYLTGLGTRAHFHELLVERLAHARRDGEGGALLLVDLDHFKTINDALSHDVGDEVLRAVGNRLSEVVGRRAFIARLGGDEFAILLKTPAPNHGDAERPAQELAQQVLDKLQSPLFVGERGFTLGASIGIVLFPVAEESQLDILRHAEMALYRAKSQGRGQTQLYLPSMQASAADRLQLEEGLRRVLANRELQLYFQPKVAADGSLVGAEGLLRWLHPELGNVSPNTFIPIAEETGLINSIGRWIIERACQHLAHWQAAAVPFTGELAINVSAWQINQPDFVEQVQQAVAMHAVPPSRLKLEVTESAVLHDLGETVTKLQQLRQLGFKISLDDFGTGYSSLSHLRELPLDELKIDRAFVEELDRNVEHPLVESMIAIGRHMGLSVVAEGVETSSQRDRLITMGCSCFQGYLFSRPLPESEFLEWLRSMADAARPTPPALS